MSKHSDKNPVTTVLGLILVIVIGATAIATLLPASSPIRIYVTEALSKLSKL